MSGLSAATWRARTSGVRYSVPGPATFGSSLPGTELRAGAGRQIDDDVAAAVADALDDLAIKFELHAGAAGLRIAHMDVRDRRAGLGGIDRLLRDVAAA